MVFGGGGGNSGGSASPTPDGGGAPPPHYTTATVSNTYGAVGESDTVTLLGAQYCSGSSSAAEDSDECGSACSAALLHHSENCYQRQPLLPQYHKEGYSSGGGGGQYHDGGSGIVAAVGAGVAGGSNSSASSFFNSTAAQAVNAAVNGLVKIPMPSPHRDEPRFPKEKLKTFWSFLMLLLCGTITNISLALTHERVPDQDPPLPDAMLDTLPYVSWGLQVCEIILISMLYLTVLLVIFHKHRYIVLRRIFVIMSLLYLYRAVTMYVTALPKSNPAYYCSPKHNRTTAFDALTRSLHIMAGLGLSMNGFHTYCGDYIFSGHTCVLVIGYLVVQEYTPKRWWLLHWLYGISTLAGVVFLLLGRGHYSVDCVLAYFITTRLWFIYHTMASNPNLKESGPHNYFSRMWWFKVFRYFEGNVGGSVPRQYEWPLPWPRRWAAKLPQRTS